MGTNCMICFRNIKYYYNIPEASFCTYDRKIVLPTKKLIQAAAVPLTRTSKVPGSNPKMYPLDAVNGNTGIANISATI